MGGRNTLDPPIRKRTTGDYFIAFIATPFFTFFRAFTAAALPFLIPPFFITFFITFFGA